MSDGPDITPLLRASWRSWFRRLNRIVGVEAQVDYALSTVKHHVPDDLYLHITCGHSHPNPRTEEHYVGAREAVGAPEDTAGCGRVAVWTMMYRCTECGRFFHRECAERHFTAHKTEGRT